MTVRPILQIGDPGLREQTRELGLEELRGDLVQAGIDDLIETMRHAKGAGLAANQVGWQVRACVIEVKDNPRYPYKPNIPLTVLVNARWSPLSDERFECYEGCLSVPDLRGMVARHVEIRVQALDRHGAPLDFVVRGLSAGTYQHELDHLDGRLFVDAVEDRASFASWASFERYHKEAFSARARALVDRFGA